MTLAELRKKWPHITFDTYDDGTESVFVYCTGATLQSDDPEGMDVALTEMHQVLLQGPRPLSNGLTRIHVNKNRIASNRKHGTRKPVVTAKTYSSAAVRSHRENRYGHEAHVKVGDMTVASIIYRPDDPLPCGARLWIETDQVVEVVETYSDVEQEG